MRKSVVLLGIVLVFVVLGLGLFVHVNLSASLSAVKKTTPTLSNPLDPAYYGLPPTIAGYKVFAVQTSENTECMPPGRKIIVIQVTQPIEDYLRNGNAIEAAIEADMAQKGFDDHAKWELSIVGPGARLDEFLAQHESWNDFSRTYGCVTSGPAPTPAH